MKSALISMGRLAKRLPLIFLLLGCLSTVPLVVVAQPQATFVSPPFVYTPINVNATNFINTGVWNITTPSLLSLPFQTFSTYNYTNSGTMNCSIGWEFDHGPWPFGTRGWAANFYNETYNPANGTGGIISALDGSFLFSVSKLMISATNIVNKGMLTAGPYGLLILNGSGVNLSRSGLEITPIQGIGSDFGDTNFTPDTAIYDQYWFGGTNVYTFVGSAIWTGTIVDGQDFFPVGTTCGGTGEAQIGPLIPQAVDSFTNQLHPFQLVTTNSFGMTNPPVLVYSNQVRQAIFASVGDAHIIPSVRFGPSLGPTNIFLPMVAQFLTYSTNVVTGGVEDSTIYVADDLAAVGTNGSLVVSTFFNPGAICQDPTYRPDSVLVSRLQPFAYALGQNYYGVPTNTFFYESSFSNLIVNGQADAYSALVDNLASEPPAGFTITNAPGRIEIYANNLNVSNTRMSAAAGIFVQASNLVSSAGANIDCQNLSYDLGSTNGYLNITNLAKQTVQRFQGTVAEWSGFWTNYQINIYTNYILDATSTNVPNTNYVRSDITNVVEIDLAITVVDGRGLVSVIPVTVLNLSLHSTNMVVSDIATVSKTLLFDGQSLTIQGGVILADPLLNWTTNNAPTLRFFTNNGVLSIPQNAFFGNDGLTNYAVFVNNGTINAGNETINSSIFLSGGTQSASQGFYMTTSSGKIENGTITSSQDAQFTAGTLKLNNSIITADGQLYFNVSSSLFDVGGSSGNFLTCGNGFNLPTKPATGDLLGTSLQTITPVFAAVDHYWSGLDLGNSATGYTNNEAVGSLVLNEGSDSEFIFHATGAKNAIYVDLLDLSQCPDFLDPDVVTIDPNFMIYYAAVTLPSSFDVPPNTNGIPQEPEEYLNGKLGGHLVWVSSFAGPNSSVDVLINGKTMQVNKALRYSKIIDSNGDGIPNFYDANPFNPAIVLTGSVAPGNLPPAKQFAISWTAAPNTIYQVQYSTNYSVAVWSTLLNYTNNAPSSTGVTVWDTNTMAGQRFYRVSHQ